MNVLVPKKISEQRGSRLCHTATFSNIGLPLSSIHFWIRFRFHVSSIENRKSPYKPGVFAAGGKPYCLRFSTMTIDDKAVKWYILIDMRLL